MSIEVKYAQTSEAMDAEIAAKRDEIMDMIKAGNLQTMIIFRDEQGDVTAFNASKPDNVVEFALNAAIMVSFAKDNECGTNTPDRAKGINGLLYLITVLCEKMSPEAKQAVIEALQRTFAMASGEASEHINVSAQLH